MKNRKAKSAAMTTSKSKRGHWVWVTRPEYFLDEDGEIENCFTEEEEDSDGGWWTCHKQTCQGDLALLYVSGPIRAVTVLIEATSDAYSIQNIPHAKQHGWDYGCEWRRVFFFESPLWFDQLRDDPYLQDWPALRGNFQQRVYRIPDEHWQCLSKILAKSNRGYGKALKSLEGEQVSRGVLYEEELEEKLYKRLSVLKRHGYDLQIWKDPETGIDGRQLVCFGNGGRIDLLCQEKNATALVVIELKIVKAGQNTFGQISNYMGWVKANIAGRRPVKGLVISAGMDTRFESSMRTNKNISHLNLSALGV
jgi:hypothetical protein